MSHVIFVLYIYFLKWLSLSVDGLLSTGPTPSSSSTIRHFHFAIAFFIIHLIITKFIILIYQTTKYIFGLPNIYFSWFLRPLGTNLVARRDKKKTCALLGTPELRPCFNHNLSFITNCFSSLSVFHPYLFFMTICVSSLYVFHHYLCFITIFVSSQWCIITICALSLFVFHHNLCYITMCR